MSTFLEPPDGLESGNRDELLEPQCDIPILLVDDRQVNLHILEKLLHGMGYLLVLATSGKEALKETLKRDFAVILLDVQMPEMDGHETAKLIHSKPKSKDVPIIFVTAADDAESQIKSYAAGAVDHLSKPVRPLILRSKVEIFAKLYRQRRQIEQHKNNLEELVELRTGQLLETATKLKVRNEELNEHRKNLESTNLQLEEWIANEIKMSREKDLMLLQQDKLASIGKLAAGIAHEINNPLGFIMCNLGTLKKYTNVVRKYLQAQEEVLKTYSPEKQYKQLEELRIRIDLPFILEEDLDALISESLDGAERVKRIVLDLKDFARSDESAMQTTDLNHCVQSAVNMVRNEIRCVADLDLSLGTLPPVNCNPQQINLVVVNLLTNAGHAMTDHGRISVTTSCVQERILLSVADTGKGIPSEVIGNIFDPFFTTKPVGQGVGLGLSTSYDIIKNHGGEITVFSEPGVGTTFTISLPLGGTEVMSE